MIGKSVVGRHRYMIERNRSLLPQRSSERFHIGAVLIIGFDKQYRTRAQRVRPPHIVPIFRVPLGLGKKFLRIRSSYRVQLRFPALQPRLPLLRIGIDRA
jgi:hypothetical protein